MTNPTKKRKHSLATLVKRITPANRHGSILFELQPAALHQLVGRLAATNRASGDAIRQQILDGYYGRSELFRAWLRGQTAPAITINGVLLPREVQDAYYEWDYRRWNTGLPATN